MKTYSIEQVADILQLKPETIRQLARTGRLTGFQIGRRWRFTEQDLEQFAERNRPPVKEAHS
jgi:excisionase family DNA binding protein